MAAGGWGVVLLARADELRSGASGSAWLWTEQHQDRAVVSVSAVIIWILRSDRAIILFIHCRDKIVSKGVSMVGH